MAERDRTEQPGRAGHTGARHANAFAGIPGMGRTALFALVLFPSVACAAPDTISSMASNNPSLTMLLSLRIR